MRKHRTLSLICLLLLVSLLSSCSTLESLLHQHDYHYEYTQETHWKVCPECGEKTSEEPHSLTLKETVDASCDHAGYTTYECRVCGFSRTDMVSPLAHQFEVIAGSDKRVCSVCGREESALAELPESERYGYRYLASLENGQTYLRVYLRISAAIGSRQDSVTIDETISKEELAAIFHCCVTDHPEYFWAGTDYHYSYTPSGLIKEVQLANLISEDDLESAKTAFNNAANEILTGISSSMSNMEKELYLHDAIVKHAVYDETYKAPLTHSAYGNLVLGTSVCDGYTKLLQYLLCRCGILATTLSGYSGENHSWNVVYLGGEWYMVDPTWDDPVGQEAGKSTHTYFNCTWATFSQDHSFVQPNGKAIENYFTIPECTATKYNYFTYFDYEGDLSLGTIDRAVRAQVARGATNDFEIRFSGHGSAAEERGENISSFVRREANQLYSILASALRKSQFSINLSFSVSKDGTILKISVD